MEPMSIARTRAAWDTSPPPPKRRLQFGIGAPLLISLSFTAFFLFAASADSSPGSAASIRDNAEWEADQRLPEDLFETTIRTAYDALETYSGRSGNGIRFALANLTTYGEPAFDRLRIFDIATMPDHEVIDVRRQRRSTSYPSGEQAIEVLYKASWRTQEAGWRGDAKTLAGLDLTLSAGKRLLAKETPMFRDLRAVTTYDVTATLEGKSRSYRASFFWFKAPAQTEWDKFDLLVVDHITQGVETALRETIPTAGNHMPSPDAGSDPGDSLTSKATCVPEIVASNSYYNQGQGTNSHVLGSHVAGAFFDYACNCDASCSQTCQAGVNIASCDDSGLTTNACHKMGSGTDVENTVVLGGGASCSSAFRCVQKSCLLCLCGISVSVSLLGGQVSYGGDSGEWSFQRKWNFSCPTCRADPNIDDDPPNHRCGAGVSSTSTASIDLSSKAPHASLGPLRHQSGTAQQASKGSQQVLFPLHRLMTQGGESFILDEWAVVSDGAVVATSDPEFGRAAARQGAVPPRGTSLIVQKPIHVMNERYVPEPGIAVNGSGLPRLLRGEGEVVAARIEFGPSGRTESVDLLYSSAPIDEEAIQNLLRRRVFVSFAGGKRHRAAAYVVVGVTDALVLRGAISVLPQCCCGATEGPVCV